MKEEVKSVYIHIPFCKSICTYCDFCKMYYNEKLISKYLSSLEEEIKENYSKEEINTIYIGGGTPSSLSIKDLKKLFSIIKIFNLSKDYEFTIECNFEDITKEKITLMKENKVNRISIGLETTNKNILKSLGRKIDKIDVIEKINLIKSLKIENINVDLMYALPGETIKDLKEDLDFVLKLKTTHISIYSLILEPHTKLYLENPKLINEDEDLKMYQTIHKILTKEGYEHYEISNYCKKGYRSKHNTVYWKNKQYYGFGLGASGYINDIRYQNTKSPNKYFQKKYIYEEEKVNKCDKMSYEMILGLRLKEGVSYKEFAKKYNYEIKDIFNYEDLLKNKFLKENKDRLYIPSDKWYVINSILLRFMEEDLDGKK